MLKVAIGDPTGRLKTLPREENGVPEDAPAIGPGRPFRDGC